MKKNLLNINLITALTICGTATASLLFQNNPFLDFIHKNHKDNKKNEIKAGQECKSNKFSITSLPYWDPTKTLPCMYSGTLAADAKNDHNLFFWLVKNPTLEKPNLVVWLNGGPGASSMAGLFLENGPLLITQPNGGKDPDDFLVSIRDGAWTELADVVYIDNPVNTGFSYGNSYINHLDDAASDFVYFIDQFLTLFPEYSVPQGGSYYLAGESFAGKYISIFGRKLVVYEDNQGKGKAYLGGVLMGDPLISAPVQRLSTHKVAQSLGIVDDSNLDQISTLHKQCEQSLSSNWDISDDTCSKVLDYIQDVSGDVLSYDARIFTYDQNKITAPYIKYLSQSGRKAELYSAIHIEKSTKVPIWEKKNQQVANALNSESMFDSTNWFDMLYEDKPVLIYAGQWDQRDGPSTIEDFLANSRRQAKSTTPISQQPRQIYYVKQKDGTFIVGGYQKYDSDSKLTILTIPKAGHFSKQALCHKDKPEDCQVTQTMCTFMSNCNGNGVCGNNGQCQCNIGFKGADCSEKVEILIDQYYKKIKTNGTQWLYYQYNTGLANNLYYEVVFSSQMPIDIFISSGWQSDPNEFKYDLALRQQNYVRLTSKQFPNFETFTAAVKVNGIEHYSTTFHQSNVGVKFNVYTDPDIKLPKTLQYDTKLHHSPLQSQNIRDYEYQADSEIIEISNDTPVQIDEVMKEIERLEEQMKFDANFKGQKDQYPSQDNIISEHNERKHHKDGGKKPQGKMFYQVLWTKLQPIINKIVHFDIYFPYFLTIIVFGFFFLMYFKKKQQNSTAQEQQKA
ncbi:kex1 protein precursor [Stylonychia lemnae]|uniref:Kex1 protein n=1 Tax=Stylonychia lemnae TaxID=5949 RepID=A0A078APP7_STYLE|nr:kex1 protein precursor [Stylonychia lemnae]|eukprot:CDW84139.1 kex1 protein precursor [Stylonychia lemnae]